MGTTEPAPAYNDLFTGPGRPSNMSGYTLVPTDDAPATTPLDMEQHQHTHHQHGTASNRPALGASSADTEHIHCEACDRLIERKQKRASQQHCCTMVAVTFIVAFLCLMILGIVIVHGK